MAASPSDNTTMAEVLAGYAHDGYVEQLVVDEDGRLRCTRCGAVTAAGAVELHSLRRLEGASDPDDMLAVLALSCPACDALGTAVVPFGPQAGPGQAAFLAAAEDCRQASPGVPASGPSTEA